MTQRYETWLNYVSQETKLAGTIEVHWRKLHIILWDWQWETGFKLSGRRHVYYTKHTHTQHTRTCLCNDYKSCWFLGAFAKLRKASINFAMSVRLSVRPHGSVRLPLDGYTWNLTFEDFFFENLSIKYKSHYNLTRITGTVQQDQYRSFITSRSVLVRMRNVSDIICGENQTTHFVFRNVF